MGYDIVWPILVLEGVGENSSSNVENWWQTPVTRHTSTTLFLAGTTYYANRQTRIKEMKSSGLCYGYDLFQN